jgi:hypothetical protein
VTALWEPVFGCNILLRLVVALAGEILLGVGYAELLGRVFRLFIILAAPFPETATVT